MEKRTNIIKVCLTDSEYKALDLIKEKFEQTTNNNSPYKKKWTNGEIIRACLQISYCKLILKQE